MCALRFFMPSTSPIDPSRNDVWKMFNRIAPSYDRLNRVISGGLDVRWRAEVAARLPGTGAIRVLDLATGTGDQLVASWQTGRVRDGVGLDLAEDMLALGQPKMRRAAGALRLGVGDATAIPEPDQSFDAVTISFGIRNVTDVALSLREMFRVLRGGGRVIILESSQPQGRLMRAGHLFYIRNIMPRVAGWLSGDHSAYRYLNQTIEHFPDGERF